MLIFPSILLLQLTVVVDLLSLASVEDASLLVRCRCLELCAHITHQVAVQHLKEYQH